MIGLGLALAERGWVPDAALRFGIRRFLAARLAEASPEATAAFVASLGRASVALETAAANEQHYELPAEFFALVLGPHLKYSSGLWPGPLATLGEAEARMLAVTADRAGLADGQDILELGCGWGSLSGYVAGRYPNARVTGVSNSAGQRNFIDRLGHPNLRIATADMNRFDPGERFDRIVSVEMFEHMRNWPDLLDRVAGWLKPGGRLFIHVFCHRRYAYPFEVEGPDNWMGRYFFTGGMMPSWDLLANCQTAFATEARWEVDGTHYQRTAAAWRRNLEAKQGDVMAVLRVAYGADASRWYERWRLFFLACEELFGYRNGTEWLVGHYRLSPI